MSEFEDIFDAAAKGTVEDVKYFLDSQETNINAKSEIFQIMGMQIGGETPLHSTARAGNVEVGKFLISKGADIEAQDISNFTPLHLAASKWNVKFVEFLVSEGANINARDEFGQTPLHSAARSDHEEKNNGVEIINILVVRGGADINAKDRDGVTALHAAATVTFAKALISAGAEVNVRDNSGLSPLDLAKVMENTEKWHFLSGLAPVPTSSFTDIFDAAKEGSINDVRYFVEKEGIDVNTRNEFGNVPLLFAVVWNSYEVVQYLISQGADVNAKGYMGRTPLHGAADTNSNIEVLKYLISRGADVKAKTSGFFGKTPLKVANTEEKKRILRKAMQNKISK